VCSGGSCFSVDTDALTQAGFQISYDDNGNINGAIGPGVDVTFVNGDGNVVGTLAAGSDFTLSTVLLEAA
jgi:hypothetical protein